MSTKMRKLKFTRGSVAAAIAHDLRERWSQPRELARAHKVTVGYVFRALRDLKAAKLKLEVKHIHRATPGKPRFAYRIG